MTVWIIRQKMTAAEEEAVHTREAVSLPFDGVPDLSKVSSEWQCRQLIQALHPDKPPETIALMTDRIWRQRNGITPDDTVAVWLPIRKMVAIGRVNGGYQYKVGEGGSDEHFMPVEWYPEISPVSSFGKFKDLFTSSALPMQEVVEKEARIKILEKLPHKYNRFAKLKWLVFVLLGLQVVSFALRMLE